MRGHKIMRHRFEVIEGLAGLPPATGPLPLLPLQQTMIRAARNGDAPWANLEQVVVRDPDPAPGAAAMAAALDALVRRHEGLRLVAADGPDGQPVLVPRARAVPGFATRDWSGLTPAEQDKALEGWLAGDRAAGIDLSASPGWRVLLADLGPQGHVCVLTVHHALMDASAMAAVVEDLYDLLAEVPLPAQPGDMLRKAQAALLDLPADAAERARVLLDGAEAPRLLSRPDSQAPPSTRPLAQVRHLDHGVSERLRLRARAGGAGSFAALQAAWALVLSRWTGERDVTFGLTLAGRNRIEGHGRTVGCLIATLPQRARVSAGEGFDALAACLRAQTDALRELHAAPPESLRAWAGIAPDRPLFDTVLVFSRRSLGAELAARGKGWERRQVRLLEEGDMPLTLAVYDDPDMRLELEHDPVRLPPARAARMLDHLVQLLTTLADSPVGVTLAELGMLSAPERARLDRLGRPDRPAPVPPADLATALAERAAEHPGATAVVVPGEAVLSRAMMQARADGLAQALDRVAPPGARVALNLPRGAGQIAAVMACLATRRPFVPLDPAQGAEARAALAAAAGVAAVIGGTALPGLTVPHLAGTAPPRTARAAAPHRAPADPGDCAYVLFTSGSTGKPKGVMGRNGALAAHAAAIIDAYDLTPADRVLAVAPPAFDVALEEVLPTLLAGATVVCAPPEALTSVPVLLDLVADNRVTVLNLPASLWHLMADEMERRRLRLPPTVRLVVTGSERVSPAALAQWRQIAPGVRWINAYGPTEGTITALAHPVEPRDPPTDPAAEVPVGRPLAHAVICLTAPDGSLAPEGAPGEIRIGGAAVTLGYLDRPEETAAAYGPLPGSGQAARFYATGDRGQWRGDGALAFLGRRDRQVKLRGHRIDLTGIERTLGALPGVFAVHVAPDPGGARLIAWLAGPAAERGPEAMVRLRAEAARRLHGPSLPELVAVPALPLKSNGKIDVDRLPLPSAGVPARAAEAQAGGMGSEPVGLTADVAALFAQILGHERIDPDADFRDLGGHSLTALRLAGAIETRFGRRTRTTDLYRHPSARQLAAHLAEPADGPRYIVPIQPHGTGVPFFGVHVLGEKESLYRPLAEALGPDRPVLGLTMGPPRDPDSVRIDTIAQAYFDDLQRHYPTGPVALGAVSMAAYFAFDLAQKLMAAGREVRTLTIFDAEGPGGRPALRRWAKLAAHLGEVRRHGTRHVTTVLRTRLERARFAREAALGTQGQVNGAALVLANVRAVEAYRARPYLGPILVVRAADSYWDSPEALDTALGWNSVARGGLDMIDVPGDHLTILGPGNVARIAAALEPRLRAD